MTNFAQYIALLSIDHFVVSVLVGLSVGMLFYCLALATDSEYSSFPNFKNGEGMVDLIGSVSLALFVSVFMLFTIARGESYETVMVQTKTLTITDTFFAKPSSVYAKTNDGTEHNFLLAQRRCQPKAFVDVGFQFQAEYETKKSSITGKTKSAFDVDNITEQLCQ